MVTDTFIENQYRLVRLGGGAVRGNEGGADRPGLSHDGWGDAEGWNSAEGWYSQDPLDSSCPPEYIGVPLAEIFAAADAGARDAASAPPEAVDAGYLHGITPPGPPPVSPAGPGTVSGRLTCATELAGKRRSEQPAAIIYSTITAALFARFASREDESFAAKVNAALRNQFGGHQMRETPK